MQVWGCNVMRMIRYATVSELRGRIYQQNLHKVVLEEKQAQSTEEEVEIELERLNIVGAFLKYGRIKSCRMEIDKPLSKLYTQCFFKPNLFLFFFYFP